MAHCLAGLGVPPISSLSLKDWLIVLSAVSTVVGIECRSKAIGLPHARLRQYPPSHAGLFRHSVVDRGSSSTSLGAGSFCGQGRR